MMMLEIKKGAFCNRNTRSSCSDDLPFCDEQQHNSFFGRKCHEEFVARAILEVEAESMIPSIHSKFLFARMKPSTLMVTFAEP
jgi:hypothetical protein